MKKFSEEENRAIFWGVIFSLLVLMCAMSLITDSIVKIIEAIKK